MIKTSTHIQETLSRFLVEWLQIKRKVYFEFSSFSLSDKKTVMWGLIGQSY